MAEIAFSTYTLWADPSFRATYFMDDPIQFFIWHKRAPIRPDRQLAFQGSTSAQFWRGEKNMAILVSVFYLQAGSKEKNPTPSRQRMCLNHCFQFPPFKLFLRTCQTQQMGQKGTDSFSVHRSEQDEKKLQGGSGYGHGEGKKWDPTTVRHSSKACFGNTH